MQTIGVDMAAHGCVGVLTDGARLLSHVAQPATHHGLVALLRQLAAGSDSLSHIAVAHDLVDNLLHSTQLARVGVLRISDPPTTTMPPFHDWPDELARRLGAPGSVIANPAEISDQLIDRWRSQAIESVAIIGTFAPASPASERLASKIIQTRHPDLGLTLSHSLGPIGLLYRENAAILNAALLPAVRHQIAAWHAAVTDAGLADVPVLFVRYDGTLADSEYVREHPFVLVGGRNAAHFHGLAALADLPRGYVVRPGQDGYGFEAISIEDYYPYRSEGVRSVLGVPTSLPQLDIRTGARQQRWATISGTDHLLLREVSTVTGDEPTMVVLGDLPRVVSTTHRRRLVSTVADPAIVRARGASDAIVGAESERLVRQPQEAELVRTDAHVRAVAAGAKLGETRILQEIQSTVSYLGSGPNPAIPGSIRVFVRVVGPPCGRPVSMPGP